MESSALINIAINSSTLIKHFWADSSSSTALLYKPVDRVTRSTLVLHVSLSAWQLSRAPPSLHVLTVPFQGYISNYIFCCRTCWSTHPAATQTTRCCRMPCESPRTFCPVLTKKSPRADNPWQLRRERSVWKNLLTILPLWQYLYDSWLTHKSAQVHHTPCANIGLAFSLCSPEIHFKLTVVSETKT